MKKNSAKLLKAFVIPLLLTLIWAGLTLVHIATNSRINLLNYEYDTDSFKQYKKTELLKGEKIIGEFESKANNLGILAVRFNTYSRINDDKLLFKIKDAQAKTWIYENEYKVNQFQPNQFFTFGFPVIEDSRGKKYQFQIESLNGKAGNAVSVSSIPPIFQTRHEFSRSYLLSSSSNILDFINQKFENLLSDRDFLISSFTYLSPLALYLSYLFYFGKDVSRNTTVKTKNKLLFSLTQLYKKYRMVLLPLICIFLNAIFVSKISGAIIIVLMAVWIITQRLARLDSRASYFVGLLFLVLAPALFMIGKNTFAEKFALWAYFFLLMATVESIIEYKLTPKIKTYKNLLKSLILKQR